jgi:FAD/FMN-containing dehydrogenase
MLRYGDVRRRLLGVEIVLADGTVVSDLGGLRKDNTGLSVAALVAGTGGAFGVVTAAVFALDRRPVEVAAALAVPTGDEAALALLLAAEAEAGEWLTAFEAMSAPAVTIARRHTPGLQWPLTVEAPGNAPVLLVELASTALTSAVEDRLVALLAGASERGELVDAVVGRPDPLWAIRHANTPALPHEGIVTGMDVSVRRSRLPALRADARALVAELEPDVVLADFGHYGDGGLHMNQVWPHALGVPSQKRVDALKEALFDLVVVRHGGSFSAEHGIGPLNRAAYERFVSPARRRLAGSLQDLLDPNHTLGRVDLR